MNTKDFLKTVVTADSGYFCLAVSDGSSWKEIWFTWPNDLDKIVETAISLKATHDVYFSSYLFRKNCSQKEYVLPSRTIQADLDEADVNTIPIQPTILVKSSNGRHQAYWVLGEQLNLEHHEFLSKRITYAIPKCDKSGWPLGRKLRVVGTYNHKYEKPIVVEVVNVSTIDLNRDTFKDLPTVDIDERDTGEEYFGPTTIIDIGPNELLESIKQKIQPSVYIQYNIKQKDRSTALWALMCAAFRAGLDRDHVFHLAKNSANNKFNNNRRNADVDLAKDVIRAEREALASPTNIKEQIVEIRKLSALMSERRTMIANVILKYMKDHGDFIRTSTDLIWYIENETGRPTAISTHSEFMQTYMNNHFGINASETEQGFTINHIAAYARSIPVNASLGSLCFYDIKQNSVLLHTGRRDVIRISQYGIETTRNGTYGVVFPWNMSNEPFSAEGNVIDWARVLFESGINNVVGAEKESVLAVLRVWFLFLLLRDAAVSRPILAFFGQPGSGKSTLFRRIFTLLFGKNKSLGSITDVDDFDHAVSVEPLIVLDNVDSWEKWLPDRLALAASTSDITKRKLYTDTDTVVIKRQALLGITAHNPRFGREDVSDRLLIFNFERLRHFRPEGEIIDEIASRRNQLWASIVSDLQNFVIQEKPCQDDCPQFRVEDFARVGMRIANSIGIGKEFYDGIVEVRQAQTSFNLDEDSLLVTAIQKSISKNSLDSTWKTPTAIWNELEACASDPRAFQRIYHNSVNLGKKLWAMHDSLKGLFNISWKIDEKGTRVWLIKKKEDIQQPNGTY